MMQNINEIYECLENKLYLPALALALTLPDICGQIEYPEYISNSGYRKVSKQYEAWCRNWLEVYFSDYTGYNQNSKQANNPYFTADMCYQLRCSFLHSGNIDVIDERDNPYQYTFDLSIGGATKVGKSWYNNDKSRIYKNVRIDIEELCRNICAAVSQYYAYKGVEYFEDYNPKIININTRLANLNK